MIRNVTALILSLVLTATALMSAPLRRVDLPAGVSFLDVLQAWKIQQQFPSVRLIPGPAPAAPTTGVLYVDDVTGHMFLHRNGSFHQVVTQADDIAALMQGSGNGVDAGAWNRINFIGPGITVNTSGTQLNVTIPTGGGGGGGSVPAGSVVAFAGAVAPSGFVLCYGQAISRAGAPDLFSAIGTIYGAGNGTTTFNVPDLRGRDVAGLNNMGGADSFRLVNASFGATGFNPNVLGQAGGVDRRSININNLPPHSHTLTQTLSGLGVGTLRVTVEGGLAATSSTGLTGGGQAMSSLPPMMVLNYIIKL